MKFKTYKYDKHYMISIEHKEFTYGFRVNERYKDNDTLRETKEKLIKIVLGMEKEKFENIKRKKEIVDRYKEELNEKAIDCADVV